MIRKTPDFIAWSINVDMWVVQKKVYPIETDGGFSLDTSTRGELKHLLQSDSGFGSIRPLAHQSRPHGIMQRKRRHNPSEKSKGSEGKSAGIVLFYFHGLGSQPAVHITRLFELRIDVILFPLRAPAGPFFGHSMQFVDPGNTVIGGLYRAHRDAVRNNPDRIC